MSYTCNKNYELHKKKIYKNKNVITTILAMIILRKVFKM